jgi:hypothetical protein
MHTRTEHFKAVFGAWWAVVTAIWSLISSADTLVGKYGSDSLKKWWDAAWTPKWGWKVWIIGLLIITLAFVLEFTFREIRKKETDFQQQLDEEKDKNQRPDYKGTIYEVFVGPAAYFHLPNKELIVVSKEDSIVAINVGIINMRNVGHSQVGTTIHDYQMDIEIDGMIYKGRRQHIVPELQTVLLRLGPSPYDARCTLNLEGDNFGAVFYLHERRGYIPFYVDGLKYEPEKNQRCNISLTMIDLFGHPHTIKAQDCPLMYDYVTCEVTR